MSGVVATALLIVVTVVALTSFQTWYGTYQSAISTKMETKSTGQGTFNVERISFDGINTNIMIKNTAPIYYVIYEVKIDGTICTTDSEIIGENGITELTTDCSPARGSNVDILIIIDDGIYSFVHIVR